MNRVQEFLYCFAGGYLFACYPLVYAEEFDPTELSIEQLMDSDVTTVSRTEQKFADTAAAVYVITQEDIQRSGVTSIPEVLRMAPGVHVARISSSEWAITARGFNGRFANKLLVLLDGRTVYSPTYAGVRWENLDLILEDIDRIEVIRGPGASVWGQNAVNGVINIITKHTEETQQGLFSIAAGNEERAIIQLRYGDQLNQKTHYRVFGKFVHRDGFIDQQSDAAADGRTQGLGGFRMDWNSQQGDRILFEGDGYIGEANDNFLFPTDDPSGSARDNFEQNSGANIMARWEHDISLASTVQSQFYYEYINIVDNEFGNENSHTLDFDFQHDIALSKDNYFNWGLGYRLVIDHFFDGEFSIIDPNHQNLHLVSAFVQDKAIFFDGALHFTFGTKVQYYTLSGWDFQPTARLLWKVHPAHRLWASFSRATRSPSRGETAFSLKPTIALPTLIPLTLDFQTNSDVDRELVYSYELGYRGWLSNSFSLDIALFYNDYADLITATIDLPDFVNKQLPVSFDNTASAQTWGVEVATEWRPIDPLRLQLSYSFLQINSSEPNFLHKDPENQLSFRGSYDISSTVAIDAWVRYVDSFIIRDLLRNTDNTVDNYVGLDLRIAWNALPNLELSLVGQNLNNAAHYEYSEEVFAYPKQLERSFYAQIQWYFK